MEDDSRSQGPWGWSWRRFALAVVGLAVLRAVLPAGCTDGEDDPAPPPVEAPAETGTP